MRGAIGYLYAEQELNEICKIYGYGYGTDTSKVTKYSYGGPLDEDLTGEITDSGARSITIEDINKQAGITEADYTTLNSNYGSTKRPTTNIRYPTITTSDGKSSSAGVKNLKNTEYSYNKAKIENIDVQNMLFIENYWLASRCIDSGSSYTNFQVRSVIINYPILQTASVTGLCKGESSDFDEYMPSKAVRPIVILKSNVIDTSSSTEYNGETMWNLK